MNQIKRINALKSMSKKKFWSDNLNWIGLIILALMYILTSFSFEDKEWVRDTLNSISLVIGVYLAVILFKKSNSSSDEQSKEHLNHLQQLNNKQILAIQCANQKQIQILQENTQKQIDALMESTDKQIESISKSTNNQIIHFEHNIKNVALRLTENSELLGEILGRELEKELLKLTGLMEQEQRNYADLSSFKLLRTDRDKKIQLKKCSDKFNQVKARFNTFKVKYEAVRNFLEYSEHPRVIND
tara:strand:- start:1415 stop:2146 length:732 start_codon:yes stop_codon:yes gene_type:complete